MLAQSSFNKAYHPGHLALSPRLLSGTSSSSYYSFHQSSTLPTSSPPRRAGIATRTTAARRNNNFAGGFHSLLRAKPKRGNVVDSYRTVSVNCAKCGERLFRYKKKNGTKSNLVKYFIERISEDCAGVLQDEGGEAAAAASASASAAYDEAASRNYHCPACQSRFARYAVMRGLPALKLVGGKVRMTKK